MESSHIRIPSSSPHTPQDDEFNTRLERLTDNVKPQDLFGDVVDILYEKGMLGTCLDELEELHPRTESPPPMGLFRLFNTESDTPVLLTMPASQFEEHLLYDGRNYHFVGTTPPEYYDSTRHQCAWDFREFSIRTISLEPLRELGTVEALCIECRHPFPDHYEFCREYKK
jgi:hypothetical protein